MTWPEAIIWIALIISCTCIIIALIKQGYGIHLEFKDPYKRKEE